MKYFAVLLISFSLQAQINEIKNPDKELIGKIAPIGQLHISIEKQGDQYLFTYSDAKFQRINDYKSFRVNEDDYDKLYDRIQEGFEEMPKEPIQLQINDQNIFLEFTKSMWVKNFRFAQSLDDYGDATGITQWLTQKNVDKIFGK